MRWSEKQYQDYMIQRKVRLKQRCEPGLSDFFAGTPDIEPPISEAKLQGKIQKWAKMNGYPYQCSRKSHKAKGFLTKGWFD